MLSVQAQVTQMCQTYCKLDKDHHRFKLTTIMEKMVGAESSPLHARLKLYHVKQQRIYDPSGNAIFIVFSL